MVGRRLLFDDDFSEFDVDSHQGSSSKRVDNPMVTLDGANEQTSSSSHRVNKAIEPIVRYKFDDKPVMATVEPVSMSQPS